MSKGTKVVRTLKLGEQKMKKQEIEVGESVQSFDTFICEKCGHKIKICHTLRYEGG